MYILPILTTWYVTSASWFYQSFQRTIASLEATFAVRDTIRNLNRPLFQDYTLQGRAIGFGLRIVRICLGGFSFAVAAFCYICIYIFWLLFPILCLVSLVGAFFGSSASSVASTL